MRRDEPKPKLSFLKREGRWFDRLAGMIKTGKTRGPEKLASIAAALLLAAPLFAQAYKVPEITDCGLISTGQPPPAYELKNVRLPQMVRGSNGVPHDCEIRLVFKDYSDLLLQNYLFNEAEVEGDIDRDKKVNWDYVRSRRIALGWLNGVTNLLLVSWGDSSGSHGTGHYEDQLYLVARMDARKSSVLLKKRVCAGGRAKDINNGAGFGSHYFSFDSKTQILSDRMTFSRQLSVVPRDNIPPLHYEAKEGCEAATHAYLADIHERILHRYHYAAAKLQSLHVEMFYTTQSFDCSYDIARFYFGPLARGTLILDANPGLRAKFTKDLSSEGEWFHFPQGTLVKIPLPEIWIINFYEQGY